MFAEKTFLVPECSSLLVSLLLSNSCSVSRIGGESAAERAPAASVRSKILRPGGRLDAADGSGLTPKEMAEEIRSSLVEIKRVETTEPG